MTDQVDPLDKAETRLAYERLARAKAEARVAVMNYDQAEAGLRRQIEKMRAKYNLAPGDSIDPVTFEIKQASK